MPVAVKYLKAGCTDGDGVVEAPFVWRHDVCQDEAGQQERQQEDGQQADDAVLFLSLLKPCMAAQEVEHDECCKAEGRREEDDVRNGGGDRVVPRGSGACTGKAEGDECGLQDSVFPQVGYHEGQRCAKSRDGAEGQQADADLIQSEPQGGQECCDDEVGQRNEACLIEFRPPAGMRVAFVDDDFEHAHDEDESPDADAEEEERFSRQADDPEHFGIGQSPCESNEHDVEAPQLGSNPPRRVVFKWMHNDDMMAFCTMECKGEDCHEDGYALHPPEKGV